MKDEETGDIIVKLVNMLPVETTIDVDLKKFFPDGQGAVNSVRTVMNGAPSQEKASIKTDRVSLASPFFSIPLPAYSFTVLRIK